MCQPLHYLLSLFDHLCKVHIIHLVSKVAILAEDKRLLIFGYNKKW